MNKNIAYLGGVSILPKASVCYGTYGGQTNYCISTSNIKQTAKQKQQQETKTVNSNNYCNHHTALHQLTFHTVQQTATMASSGSGYDLSSATFSPDGRIFQVEYANKAVENAGTILGIHASDGVVLGVLKPLVHKMVVPTTASYKRIHTLDHHVGVATTGFTPDARVLVGRAQEECSSWQEQYGTKIPPHVLMERMGQYAHYFTLHGALRPFGASVLLAGYDAETQDCSLHLLEPSGASYQFYGVATGKGKQVAKTELEKLNLHKEPKLTLTEAVQHVAKILTLLHQENKETDGKPMALELSWICQASKWRHQPVPQEVVKAAEQWAAEQLEEDDDEEEEEPEEAMEE